MSLDRYCRLFSELRRAPGAVWTEATLRRAPHKPMLLLAMMDLVARGVLTSKFISIEGELVELNELFTDYWRAVVPVTQTSSIAFPFSRLHNEPFWRLVPRSGGEVDGNAVDRVSTVTQLRALCVGAVIDDELFALMATPDGREALTLALLRSSFSAEAQRQLLDQVAVHQAAFRYSQALESLARQPEAADTTLAETYTRAARDQGFRRVVVNHYDHRCALCGTRIVTPEGHSAVDAAHIVPWSESRNDDIRNGMALCKLCHWAFDEGLMGVSADYTVRAARQLTAHPNVAGFLGNLAGRTIIGPDAREVWPGRDHLAEHRRRFRL